MAKYTLLNARVLVGGYELSGDSNSVNLTYEAEEVDATTFGAIASRTRVAGLKNISLESTGYASHATTPINVDPALWNVFGIVDQVTSVSGQGNDGDIAFSFNSVETSLKPFGGEVGEMSSWDLVAGGSGEILTRSTILEPAQTSRTVTGTGTARNLGLVGTGQSLYASLHVLSVAGTTPSLTVKIQSDDGGGMGTPTDRITFTAATVIGAQRATPVLGPIATDNWWRAQWTISGGSPAFLFFVTAGIQ